jgi:hypothetical protein
MLHPPADLLDIAAAQGVGVAMMIVAVVARVVPQALLFPGQSLGLSGDRVGKRKRLPASPNFMLIMGKRAVDRIAQERDELDLRDLLGRALGNQRMEEVVGRRVQGQ